MRQHLLRLVENRTLWSNVQRLVFTAPELALALRPGQFALVRDPAASDPYLRRTAWFFEADRERAALTLSSADPIARRARAGDWLDVLAPLGRPIEFAAGVRQLLLVGEGAGLARLVPIARHAITLGWAVVLVASASDAGAALPAALLPPEVEYRAGLAVETELIAWADTIIACGPAALYRSLADATRSVGLRLEPGRVRALIDLAMPCGTGACGACAVPAAGRPRLACVDGPTFDLAELENWTKR